MNTIVCNTLSGAVSEYDFTFQSITPNFAGSAVGLYSLGGDTDAGALIVSRIVTGKPSWGESVKKLMDKIFYGMKGAGEYQCIVTGESVEYAYPFTASASGESRAQPGRGIRETYLGFGFSNPKGQDFQIDTIEVVTTSSTNRRV